MYRSGTPAADIFFDITDRSRQPVGLIRTSQIKNGFTGSDSSVQREANNHRAGGLALLDIIKTAASSTRRRPAIFHSITTDLPWHCYSLVILYNTPEIRGNQI